MLRKHVETLERMCASTVMVCGKLAAGSVRAATPTQKQRELEGVYCIAT